MIKAAKHKPKHLAVLLMAAGKSERLGQAKQLVKLKGKSLLQRQVELMLLFQRENLVSTHLVIGFQQDKMTAELANKQLLTHVNVIEAQNWQQGLSSSIAAGVTHISQIDQTNTECDAVLIFMVDQWQLSQQDLTQLIRQWQQTPDKIHIASANDMLSPPVIFPQAYFNELQILQGDEGAKVVIKKNKAFVMTLDMPSAFIDLDTPEQLKQLKQLEGLTITTK